MKGKPDAEYKREMAGLCANCSNMRRVKSDRGSEFVFCELSLDDTQFAKYPRLPVLTCAGHQERTASTASTERQENAENLKTGC